VYDEETGFYYLESRYYDPTTGRFISADVLLSTGQGVLGHNCYAYCLGNPVNMEDPDGLAGILSKIKDFFTQVVFGGGGSWCGGHIWGSRYNSDPKDEWQNEQDQIKSKIDASCKANSNCVTSRDLHGAKWAVERRSYWKSQEALYRGLFNNTLSPSGTYMMTENNFERMKKGNAPIGIDGRPVNLHHPNGIANDFYNYIEVTYSYHYQNFKALHSYLYNKD
jgi:RHS repeat-associated protein